MHIGQPVCKSRNHTSEYGAATRRVRLVRNREIGNLEIVDGVQWLGKSDHMILDLCDTCRAEVAASAAFTVTHDPEIFS